jgi:hypothetical protein
MYTTMIYVLAKIFVEKIHIVPLQCTPSVNELQLTKNKKITQYGFSHKTFGLFPFDLERESSMNWFFWRNPTDMVDKERI